MRHVRWAESVARVFWVILKTISSVLSLKFLFNIPVKSLTPFFSSRYIRTIPYLRILRFTAVLQFTVS